MRIFYVFLIIVGMALPFLGQDTSRTKNSADQLIGLWKAKKRFGPDARGPLIIQKDGAAYTAEMMGRVLPVRTERGELVFELPDNQGFFRGRIEGKNLHGYWFRPGTLVSGFGQKAAAVSPVNFRSEGLGKWLGDVDPAQDTFTIYLNITKRPDGSLGVLMRNPERDIGNQLGAQSIVREGDVVNLMGKRPNDQQERIVSTGMYDSENDILTLRFVNRGVTYDFLREGDDSDFFPRGKTPQRYVYRQPVALDDSWPTATVDEVGIDRAAIEKVLQTIVDTPEPARDTPQTHGILIARHGTLVLEEYFHGFTRDSLHNNRSAAKSITATLIGAAMNAGAPLKLSSHVYEVMNGGTFPPDLDFRKRAMTLENLMMMSSGFFCDDNNENAPGQENHMWEQTEEPDFYKLFLKLPLDRTPGEKAVYCSGDPNLALGMLGRAIGDFPLYTFDRLIGGPMKITRYSWGVDHAANPYGGGGSEFVLRDFAKFGQLMLNGGTWQGRRILSSEFVTSASSAHTQIGSRKYGYLWWIGEYPYNGRNVKVYWALGNGGNTISVIPELDLVVATYSGGYFSKAYGFPTGELVPKYILPAVQESRNRKTPKK
jgi:CubicO group peptidase (beta-lactamase class C family)